jgi:hypothetical protein
VFLNCSTCFERHTAHNQEPLVLHTFVVAGSCHDSAMITAGNHKCMQLQFFSSWLWAVCRSKHVEQLRNIGIINSTTRLHLVDYFYTIPLMCFCTHVNTRRYLLIYAMPEVLVTATMDVLRCVFVRYGTAVLRIKLVLPLRNVSFYQNKVSASLRNISFYQNKVSAPLRNVSFY